MRLLMSRHGQTVANFERKFQGWVDTPLTEAGIRGAKELGAHLKDQHIDVVACSPIGRAKATAAIVMEGRDVPIYYYDELKELYMGDWEGVTLESLENDPRSYLFFNEPHKFRAPNGEDFFELQDRALRKVHELYQEYPNKTVYIVAHGLTLRVLTNHFHGKPMSKMRETEFLYGCCLTIVEFRGPDDIEVLVEGSTAHLSEVVG